MCKLKISLKVGTELTKKVFSEILLDDDVCKDSVWEIVEHAIACRKMKRGYKKIFGENLSKETANRLSAILVKVCEAGYDRAVRPLYVK